MFNGRNNVDHSTSTSSMLLLTSKGQKRPTSQLMASCDDWLRRRTTFCPRLYNRRLFELLPGITGLCWTPQNVSNYEAQESLGTNQTKSPQHDQRKLLSVNMYLVEIFYPVESAFKDQFCSLFCILPQVGDVPGR